MIPCYFCQAHNNPKEQTFAKSDRKQFVQFMYSFTCSVCQISQNLSRDLVLLNAFKVSGCYSVVYIKGPNITELKESYTVKEQIVRTCSDGSHPLKSGPYQLTKLIYKFQGINNSLFLSSFQQLQQFANTCKLFK